MNKQKYEDKLKDLISSREIDLEILYKWFEKTLELLDMMACQRQAITHPRYRGDSREDDFINTLRDLTPRSIHIAKGFATNEYAMVSQEQDCLLLDERQAATLIKTKSTNYYPIEAVLSSIEIKSKLTLSEIRKLALNCISLKKLSYQMASGEKDKEREIAYFVFAYASTWNLEETAAQVRKILEPVPRALRPNMIYILKQGFLLPGKSAPNQSEFSIGPQQLFADHDLCHRGPIRIKGDLAETHAIPFLWFISNILDHCITEIHRRPSAWIGRYVFTPILHRFENQKPDEVR